jgi:hypothetical protein
MMRAACQLYLGDQIKNNEMGGEYRVLIGRTKGKGRRGRPRRRWEYNIKMGLYEVGWRHGLDCSGSG